MLIQRDREVSKRYEVAGTPSAVLIAPHGTIASPVHGGADAIKRLVDTQITPSVLAIHHHQPVPSGPAPDVPLRTLELEEVMLSSMLSGPTAVIFWNPSCGFCERMLPDLRALEQDLPADGPSLLLISAGDPEANRAMGLDAPILLDRAFVAGNAFGAAGTPSGVLVDADGQIASHVAVGADAVLALIGADSAIAARAA